LNAVDKRRILHTKLRNAAVVTPLSMMDETDRAIYNLVDEQKPVMNFRLAGGLELRIACPHR
jgi:hypothetical protein